MGNVLPAPSLIGPPENTYNSGIPDHVQNTLGSNQSELNTAEGNKPEEWKPTVSTTVKPLLRGAKEYIDAPPPFGSVIGGLSGVEGSEPAQRTSCLHSEVGVERAMETLPGRKGSDAGGEEVAPVNDPPIPVPSISQGEKPNSM